MQEHIKAIFTQTIQTQIAAAEVLQEPLARAGELLTQSVLAGQRIFSCGVGNGTFLADQFAHVMIHGQAFERPPFPAFALSKARADAEALEHYSRQISALGGPGDILLVVNTERHATALTKAVEAGLTRGMLIIALTGEDDADVVGLLGPEDIEIRIPAAQVNRVTEQLLIIIHALCELVEQQVFPQEIES